MITARSLACCALLALGCARDIESPEAAGRACDSDVECNVLADGGTASCGRLRLCVAGRCEAGSDGGSQLVVCRD